MSRRVIAGVNEFNQDPELRGKLVNSLKQEKIYQKRAPRPKTGLTNLEIAILIVIIVFLFGLLMGLAVPLSVYVVTVPGGNTTEVAQTAFVDQRGLSQFINVLNVLTAECQPPAGSPALAMATVGKSRAQSTAAWQAIMAAVQGNPLNGTGCQFYGLLGAEARVSQQMGPADICQAYINIGIDLLHALYGFHMPTNISSILNAAFEIAYPLNIFWLNTNTPIVNQQQVVARLYAIVVCLTQPGTQCTARPIDVQGIATQFCNPFFASDDLTYYGQAFMPWLKFPFPGLLPRNGENTDAPQVRRLVSPQTIASLVANGTFLPGANATVVAVYVLGDVLATEPSMALTLDTVFGGVPRYYPSFETVPEFLDQVANHLQALDRGETIVVVARYAREFNLFNSVNFVAAAAIAFPPPLFFLFSNAVVPGDRFVATPTNLGLVTLEIQNFATSAQIINVVDVLINLTNFDGNYTREYVHEKRVATFVQNAINPFAVLGMTATLQLLDTFALKNVLVYGVDLGGHVDGAVQNFVLDRAGYFPGYRPLPLLVEAQIQTVTTPAVDRHDRRRSAPYPASLDYRTASQRNCLRPVFAQGECGGSWAAPSSPPRARASACGASRTASSTSPSPTSLRAPRSPASPTAASRATPPSPPRSCPRSAPSTSPVSPRSPRCPATFAVRPAAVSRELPRRGSPPGVWRHVALAHLLQDRRGGGAEVRTLPQRAPRRVLQRARRLLRLLCRQRLGVLRERHRPHLGQLGLRHRRGLFGLPALPAERRGAQVCVRRRFLREHESHQRAGRRVVLQRGVGGADGEHPGPVFRHRAHPSGDRSHTQSHHRSPDHDSGRRAPSTSLN